MFPTSVKEVLSLGWDYIDVILVSGDAFIDHPSFGTAVIGRWLQKWGYRVAVGPQPNWRDDLRDFRKLGAPRLYFGVNAGAMDSMVNHYTASKRLRHDDAYTPEGKAGARPDYAVTVYTKILKQLYPEVPVVIGGIEASLRRVTHYDYWKDCLMPSVLVSSGAERIAHTPREIAEILCPGTEPVRGAFLSMEGPDGSGKGTQLERLADTLDRYGFEVYRTREPGGSPIGEKIREILLDRENAAMTDVTEALLYAAARAQHVREVIRPQTAAGRVVLCDRYLDSSAAYQGGGRMLGVEQVLAINAPAVDGTLPDLTVYLDIDHRKAMARRCAATEPDRLETEPESFHARVEDGYHQLIEQDPERFAVVNAEGDRDAIAAEIAGKVLARLTEAED